MITDYVGELGSTKILFSGFVWRDTCLIALHQAGVLSFVKFWNVGLHQHGNFETRPMRMLFARSIHQHVHQICFAALSMAVCTASLAAAPAVPSRVEICSSSDLSPFVNDPA